MQSAFGVEHASPIAKADYTRAKTRYERNKRVGERVEDVGGALAGGSGLAFGAAQLRDKALKETKVGRRLVVRHADTTSKVGRALLEGKPGVKTMAAGFAGGSAAFLAAQHNKAADHRLRRLEKRPNASMRTIGKSIGKPAQEPTSMELKRRRQFQGVIGTTAAGLGLSAFAAKSGARLLPKITRGGVKGAKYARHLDRGANAVLFGASGVGGVSGLTQGALYRREAKAKIAKPGIAKAYDPERSRQRRVKAYQAGTGAAAVGLAGAAARPGKKIDLRAGRSMQRLGAVKFNQGAAERTYTPNLKGGARGKLAEQAADKMAEGVRLASRGSKRMVALTNTKVPGKQRLALAGGALAAGATSEGIRRHRKEAAKPYRSWYDAGPSVHRPKAASLARSGSRSPVARDSFVGAGNHLDDDAARAWQEAHKANKGKSSKS